MATSTEDIKTNYPLPVYHYNVEIGGMDNARFSEVSGLNIEHQLITYKDGLSATKGAYYSPGQMGDPKLTLKRGVFPAGSGLYDWIASIQVTLVEKRDVLISLMDESGEAPLVTWKAIEAFPLKFDAPAFNAASNEVAIESLDLAASRITVEYQS